VKSTKIASNFMVAANMIEAAGPSFSSEKLFNTLTQTKTEN